MSYKDMVTKYVPASTNNYTSGRFDDIHGIVIHHAATTSLSAVDATFSNPSRQASAHFAVCGKEVHQYVDLNDTAWHCGNWEGNCCTVGIELVNSTITPDYRVSEETFNTAIKLVAKLAKDLGLGKIAFEPDGVYPSLSAHRDWSATYCVPVNETELLTRDGWKLLKDIEIGEDVATALLDGLEIKFSPVLGKVPEKVQDTWKIRDIEVTADHRMLWRTQRGKFDRINAFEDLPNNQAVYIPNAGFYNGKGLPLSDNEIKLLIAVQADGHYENGEKSANGRVTFHVSKDRKIKLLDDILAGYSHKKYLHSDGTVSYNVSNIKELCEEWLDDKQFSFKWLNLSPKQAELFLDTILDFDGCRTGNDYSSYKKQNIDVVDAIAAINGIGVRHNSEMRTCFVKDYRSLDKRNGVKRITGKTVSCVTVESGFILVRQNGRTTIIGNCPGDYVYSRMNEMAKKVNDINYPPYVPAVLEWKKLDKPVIYVTEKEPTSLRDFNHTHYENCKAVKSFSKGTEIVIYGKVYNKTIDKTFLLTEYSYTNKITNGFLSDDMAIKVEREEVKVEASIQESKAEEPKVESEPLKEVQEEAELTRGLTEEDYMAVIQKAQESLELIENEVKNTGFTIKMSSKVYDVLKFIAIVVLPAISALYIGLSNIWGFGFGEQVDATVQLVIAIINALLGLTVAKSNYDYKKNQ